MARVISISNQKGGVGKTTTAVNLAAGLALQHCRTLLIDLDPQGNASSGVGYPRTDVERGVYEAMMGLATPEDCILSTSIDNLHVLPTTRDLVGAEVELVEEHGRERYLRKVINEVRDNYDFILIDCPPSLSLLTINGLTASDSVLIPLQAEYYAMEGLGELLRTIAAVRRGLNPDLVREGIVITMTDRRNTLCREVERQARHLFGQEVFETAIPRNIRLGEAPSHGVSIHEYDKRSRGSSAYAHLARELITKHRSALRAREAV